MALVDSTSRPLRFSAVVAGEPPCNSSSDNSSTSREIVEWQIFIPEKEEGGLGFLNLVDVLCFFPLFGLLISSFLPSPCSSSLSKLTSLNSHLSPLTPHAPLLLILYSSNPLPSIPSQPSSFLPSQASVCSY